MLDLKHKKLEVWKKSMDFVADIYQLTEGFPKNEVYGITNQLRRAAVSVPSNIAEGCARKSSLERKRFYEIARSSLVEIDTQLEISQNLNYFSSEVFPNLEVMINQIFAMLSSLIKRTYKR